MLETHVIETAPNPRTTIIVLHGLGADGHDFVPICGELDLASIGPVRYVFPHAPQRPVTINNGYVMRAWYDIKVADLVRKQSKRALERLEQAAAKRAETLPYAAVVLERVMVIGGFDRVVLSAFGLREGVLLERMSREALAKRFDRPEGTIKTWLHRSLAQLKGCLER